MATDPAFQVLNRIMGSVWDGDERIPVKVYEPALISLSLGRMIFSIARNVMVTVHGEGWEEDLKHKDLTSELVSQRMQKHLKVFREAYNSKTLMQSIDPFRELIAIRDELIENERVKDPESKELSSLFIVPSISYLMLSHNASISLFREGFPSVEFLSSFCPELSDNTLDNWSRVLEMDRTNDNPSTEELEVDPFSAIIEEKRSMRSWKSGPVFGIAEEEVLAIMKGEKRPYWVYEEPSRWFVPAISELETLWKQVQECDLLDTPDNTAFWVTDGNRPIQYDLLNKEPLETELQTHTCSIILSGYRDITIDSEPTDSEIRVYFKDRRRTILGGSWAKSEFTTPVTVPILSGTYSIQLEKPGYRETEKEVQFSVRDDAERRLLHLCGDSPVLDSGSFTMDENNLVIKDLDSGLEWMVGPDADTAVDDALAWIKELGGAWRLPKVDELEALYNSGVTVSSWSFFRNSGWWAWTSEYDSWHDKTVYLNFSFLCGSFNPALSDKGVKCRVFAVRSPEGSVE